MSKLKVVETLLLSENWDNVEVSMKPVISCENCGNDGDMRIYFAIKGLLNKTIVACPRCSSVLSVVEGQSDGG